MTMVEQILLVTVVASIAIAVCFRWVTSRKTEAKFKFKQIEVSIKHED